MKGVAWKDFRRGDDYFYVIQLNGIRGKREEKRVKKYFKDWRFHGEGFDPKSKEVTLLFNKSFPSDEDWKSWARLFPHELVEVGKSGKKKPYKLGTDYINSPRRKHNE
tara:strand:- start:62 stop:385 length:324 start_codon:yes stop_codon:yes gene_type:complete